MYPLINLIVTFQFVQNFTYNIEEITTLFQAKAFVVQTFAMNYLSIRRNLIGTVITDQEIKQYNLDQQMN